MKSDSRTGYIVVTGASSGIGKAIALEFAERGYDLLLTALPDSGLQDTADELARFPVTVHLYEANLTVPAECEGLFDWCLRNNFRITGLVNNAGTGNLAPFESSSSDGIFEMINLNVSAVAYLTWLFVPQLKKSPASYLLNVSSLASYISIPNKAVYSATKAFIRCFSHALRKELAASGVRVSCLCPGSTLTSHQALSRIAQSGVRPGVFCTSARFVARCAVEGLLRGEKTIVPGFINRLILTARYFVPEPIETKILRIIFSVSAKLPISSDPVSKTDAIPVVEPISPLFTKKPLYGGRIA